ncbi:MAG: prepilin-type N-terminal cleavage/methylation domain-containing protein [Lachnospiraceae bacterium]|nr:prepilin-type N-terminal cleavage/methylation domain-containing protein [Lachnospiraceae bacterium]
MKKKNNEGFSLVELIIVIAIMAVLIVVLAPQFIKFVEKGRESTDLQNITEAKTTIETYVADKGIKGSTEFTVTAAINSDISITATDVDDDALAEYGIASMAAVAPVESEEWDNTIEWKYKDYQWKLTTVSKAAYLDANGDEVE